MKRPLVWLGMALLTVLVTVLVGYMAMPILVAALILLRPYLYKKLHSHRYSLLLLVSGLFFLVTIWWTYTDYDYEQAQLYRSGVVEGWGIVEEVKEGAYGYTYTLSPWWDANGQKSDFKLNLGGRHYVEPGWKLSFAGEVQEGMAGYNQGAFDLEAYYKQKKVLAYVKGDVFRKGVTWRYPLKRWTYKVRQEHYLRLGLVLPPRERDLVASLLLGMDQVRDDDRYLFQSSGTVHILAISGLHVGLVAGLIFGILKRLRVKQRISATVVMVLVSIYCIYTGGHLSTIRATLMILIYLGHLLLYRKYDKHVSVAVAFLLIIWTNPFQMTSVGFLLSFGAVLSIFYITPALKRGFLKGEGYFIGTIRVMVAVQLGITPILVYFFYHIPVYSLLGNLLLLPLLSLVILSASLGIGMTYIHLTLAKAITGTGFWVVNYMLKTVSFIDALPLSYWNVGQPSIVILILYYSALFCFLIGRRKLLTLALCMLVVVMVTQVTLRPELTIDMMDVGNGDAVFVRSQGQVMLIDGGGMVGREGDNIGRKVLLPFMAKKGIRKIDTVVISHFDFDHMYGIIELLEEGFPIDRILVSRPYLYYENQLATSLLTMAQNQGIEIYYIGQGDKIELGPLSFKVLYPPDDFDTEDNNQMSLVMLMVYKDFEMVFTGDMLAEDEEILLDIAHEDLENVDVLKVAHHGSKTSSSQGFLETLSPSLSMVSVGRSNIYGHPAREVSQRLVTYSDDVVMTKDLGQITLIYENGQLKQSAYSERYK